VKKPAPFLVYTVLRLLAFLVPLAILWFFFPIFREYWWLAAIFAALIGMSISMLFLRRPLTDASVRLAERRESRASGSQADADAEDQAVDATDSPDEPKA
jgi:L-lactate permease